MQASECDRVARGMWAMAATAARVNGGAIGDGSGGSDDDDDDDDDGSSSSSDDDGAVRSHARRAFFFDYRLYSRLQTFDESIERASKQATTGDERRLQRRRCRRLYLAGERVPFSLTGASEVKATHIGARRAYSRARDGGGRLTDLLTRADARAAAVVVVVASRQGRALIARALNSPPPINGMLIFSSSFLGAHALASQSADVFGLAEILAIVLLSV